MKSVELPVIQGGFIPDDYLRSRDAHLNYGTNKVPITVLTPEQYDQATRMGVSTSIPTKVYVDHYARTFTWVPAPSESFSFSLRYYFMPVLPDPYTPIGDSEEPLWEADLEVLIQAVYIRALQFDDDARYDKEEQKLYGERGLLVQAKMNLPDFRATNNRIKLGKSFRRRL